MPTNTTQEPALKNLENAEAQRADVPALRFERRMAERFETIGRVEAVRMGPVDPILALNRESTCEPKIELRLIDESVTGAGFGSQAPLSPGTHLEVRIGPASAPWKSGRVVRCIATGKGYRVGVEYGRRMAA